MRHLEDTSPDKTTPVVYVPMRGKYDCMTCVTATVSAYATAWSAHATVIFGTFGTTAEGI